MKNFNIDSNKTLVVLNNSDENIYLSARNLQKVKVLRAEGINTYEILNAKKIVFVESSLKTIVEVFAKN